MRLVNIILITCFIAAVTALLLVYVPSHTNRVNVVDEAMGSEPTVAPARPLTVPAAPKAAAPGLTQDAAGTVPESNQASEAASNLKEEHARESATQFDRSLLFLAPAAASPMIEHPIATAAATPVLPQATDARLVSPQARTWRGEVLVPKNMLLATAHTSKVRIPRIEAHPLDDGNVRIWARIQNPSDKTIKVGAACTFRYKGQPAGVSRGFLEIEIPPNSYYDAAFLSPHSGVETYTILVKSED